MMKRLLALSTVASALCFSLAYAQPAPAPGTPPSPAMPANGAAPGAGPSAMPEAPAAVPKVEEHIKSLHEKLKITAEEQPKFDAFANAMRDSARAMYQAREQGMDSSLSAPDELKRYADMSQAHADATKQLLAPFQALYDSLSDAQKKKADALFAHKHAGKKH